MNSLPHRLTDRPSKIAFDHGLRSEFMEWAIKQPTQAPNPPPLTTTPRILMQFWDDLASVPADVQKCLDSWLPLEGLGFERHIFDDVSAEQFIKANFSSRHCRAFERCLHPAMRADYFRLCFILKNGGLYVDADDTYQAHDPSNLLADGRLKLQSLCYEIATDSMVDPRRLAGVSVKGEHIFYVNNNPLIAAPNHPIIAKALEQSTTALVSVDGYSRDVQSLTGPGNLTSCLVAHAAQLIQEGKHWDFELLVDWGAIATSTWPLGYRSDERNWRRWVAMNPKARTRIDERLT